MEDYLSQLIQEFNKQKFKNLNPHTFKKQFQEKLNLEKQGLIDDYMFWKKEFEKKYSREPSKEMIIEKKYKYIWSKERIEYLNSQNGRQNFYNYPDWFKAAIHNVTFFLSEEDDRRLLDYLEIKWIEEKEKLFANDQFDSEQEKTLFENFSLEFILFYIVKKKGLEYMIDVYIEENELGNKKGLGGLYDPEGILSKENRKPKSIKTANSKIKWYGSGKELAELILELKLKGYIDTMDVKAFCAFFETASKESTIKDYLYPSTSKENSYEQDFERLYNNYNPKFRAIKEPKKRRK